MSRIYPPRGLLRYAHSASAAFTNSAHLPIFRHLYTGDDYYFIYGHIKHIRKNYQVVNGGNSVPAHPLEDSLRSIETASCLHIGYLETLRFYEILYIITCCLYVDHRHREQLLSLYYDKQKHRLLTYRRCLSFVWITTQRKCSPK